MPQGEKILAIEDCHESEITGIEISPPFTIFTSSRDSKTKNNENVIINYSRFHKNIYS